MTRTQIFRRIVKPVAFVLCLIPFVRIVIGIFTGGLGANPVEVMTDRTGTWTITLLLVTLAVSPAKQLTGIGQLIGMRRMLGLFAFFYATLHFSVYLVFDQFFAFGEIAYDVLERPYITVGFTCLVLLSALALTSTKGWIKRLGGARWKALHQLVYVCGALGVLHFLWAVKADTLKPILYGAVLIALLLARLVPKRRARRMASPPARDTARPGAILTG